MIVLRQKIFRRAVDSSRINDLQKKAEELGLTLEEYRGRQRGLVEDLRKQQRVGYIADRSERMRMNEKIGEQAQRIRENLRIHKELPKKLYKGNIRSRELNNIKNQCKEVTVNPTAWLKFKAGMSRIAKKYPIK